MIAFKHVYDMRRCKAQDLTGVCRCELWKKAAVSAFKWILEGNHLHCCLVEFHIFWNQYLIISSSTSCQIDTWGPLVAPCASAAPAVSPSHPLGPTARLQPPGTGNVMEHPLESEMMHTYVYYIYIYTIKLNLI